MHPSLCEQPVDYVNHLPSEEIFMPHEGNFGSGGAYEIKHRSWQGSLDSPKSAFTNTLVFDLKVVRVTAYRWACRDIFPR